MSAGSAFLLCVLSAALGAGLLLLAQRLGWVGAGQWGVKLQDEVVKPAAPSQEA